MANHPLWRPLETAANENRQSVRVAYRQTPPGPPQTHSPQWADDYRNVRSLIDEALGDQVLAIHHVGSTAVDDLIAKPVIDIDLTVPDVTDESAYLPHLEAVGFRLIFRDQIGPDDHRQCTLAQPNTNLHIWSPGAAEPQRHLIFLDWLSRHPEDRRRYEAAKLAALEPDSAARYNDRKAATVHAIYDRAFQADPR